MLSRQCALVAAACTLAISSLSASVANAQANEVKDKPPMYSYISNWAIPRARWPDMEKQAANDAKVFDKALSSGKLVAYGDDINLVHNADGETHDSFWSAMSLASLMDVLDELHKSGASTAPVLTSATKHYDEVLVSRFYNWKAGTMKGGYTEVAAFKLKAGAPDDALETISKSFTVPMLEKLLAAGVIMEYEIDTQAVHTEAPGTFLIVYITPTADGLDKVNAALREALKANPFVGPAFDAMVDSTAHHDGLYRTNATYK
jgi:hypothetical protein